MAGIYNHTKGVKIQYTLYFPDGTFKVKYRYKKTKALAEEILRKVIFLEKGSRAGDLNRREIITARHDKLISEDEAQKMSGGKKAEIYDLDRLCDVYEASSKVVNTKYGHTVNMRRVALWKNWLERHPIPSLTEEDINRYISDRKSGRVTVMHPETKRRQRGVSAKTVNNEITILKLMINQAVKLGMVEENVVAGIKVPTKKSRIPRAYSHEEIKKVLVAAKANTVICFGLVHAIVMTVLYAGLRRGELASLKWEDVDLEARVIHIQGKDMEDGEEFTPKGGGAESVVIPDKLHEIFTKMERRGPYVFSKPDGSPLRANLFYRGVKEIIFKAGVDSKLTLHHGRHTFGSELLKKTKDLKYTQQRMRHKDVETTKNYLHVIMSEEAPERDMDYGEDE